MALLKTIWPKLKNFRFIFLLSLTIILTLGLSLSLQSLLAAWTAPLANPPACTAGNPGCDAPLNAGPLVQTKGGGLWINTGGVSPYGLIVETGNVGIGTTNPTGGKLVVNGGNLDMSTNKIVNLAAPVSNADAATKAYVDAQASASSGSACPDNYANLCSNGGGLQFTYSGKTLSIDAFPRHTTPMNFGGASTYESIYGLAWQHCERIGARLPTLAEWQAACSALGGPSGNGLTTFGGYNNSRWEFTATPYPEVQNYVYALYPNNCSSINAIQVDNNASLPWFRCIR